MLQLCEKHYYERPLQIVLEVQGLCRALVEARPDSMPLINFASEAVRPLPELYGRGRHEGARMRGDLRARVEAWLAGLDTGAAQLQNHVAALEAGALVVSARAIDAEAVYVPRATLPLLEEGGARYAVAGREKLVPANWQYAVEGLERVPLEAWTAIITEDGPMSASAIRSAIAELRLENALL
jgi:hypothetical protein